MLSGPRQAKVDQGPRAPQGRVFHSTHHSPPLSFSFPAPHPFPPLALPSDNPHQRGNAKDLFRAGPGSSPFEVSGVLALHGGGGSVVGRMGVSESLGRLLSGTRPKYPHSRGGDSPEACKAGRRRRCGYHGEAAGSSHSSWAPETLERPDPPRSTQGACAHATAAVCAGSVVGPGSRD